MVFFLSGSLRQVLLYSLINKMIEKYVLLSELVYPKYFLVMNGPFREKTMILLDAINKGPDQPAHLCSLISIFVIDSVESIIHVVSNFSILAGLQRSRLV